MFPPLHCVQMAVVMITGAAAVDCGFNEDQGGVQVRRESQEIKCLKKNVGKGMILHSSCVSRIQDTHLEFENSN